MESVGEELKRAREAQGIPLRDMATRTQLSIGTLEALERGDLRRIPGGIFGRSFVRNYAIEAGLDPDGIVEKFAEQLAEAERIDAERRRARQPAITLDDKQFLERQRRAFLLLRVGIVVAVIAAILIATLMFRGTWFGVASPGAVPGTVSTPVR